MRKLFKRSGRIFSLLAVLMMLLPILLILYFVLPFPAIKTLGSSTNMGFKPRKLEALLEPESCFYDEATGHFVFPGTEFGCSFSEMAAATGLDKWYDRGNSGYGENVEEVEEYIETNESARIHMISGLSLSAFDKVYSASYDFSDSGLFSAFGLSAGIITKDNRPRGEIHQDNAMKYADACDYAYGLIERFTQEYGEPTGTDFSIDLRDITLENICAKEKRISAYWISENEELRSGLEILVRIRTTEDQYGKSHLVMNIHINVGQEVENVILEDNVFMHF